MSEPSPVKKWGYSQVVKIMEKINNMDGEEAGSQRERAESLVASLERPFIRCSSCWVIHFSILPSHVVEIWPGKPVGRGKWVVCLYPPGKGFIFFRLRLRAQPGKPPCKQNNSRFESIFWFRKFCKFSFKRTVCIGIKKSMNAKHKQ